MLIKTTSGCTLLWDISGYPLPITGPVSKKNYKKKSYRVIIVMIGNPKVNNNYYYYQLVSIIKTYFL